MSAPPSKNPSQLSAWPQPSTRLEWLRWPVSFGIAALISLGLLACLGSVIPSGIRLVPQRLLAALVAPQVSSNVRPGIPSSATFTVPQTKAGISAERPAR